MNDTTVQLTERRPPNFPGAPDASRRPVFHHVQLKTVRLDEMIAWYTQVVGMVIAYKGPTHAWLTNDDSNHRLALVNTPRLRDDPDKLSHVGLHHTAWEYANIDELLACYERLRDAGVLPHRTVDHGPIVSFYYEDPDGNSVELQVDNYGDWAESAKFFETPEFAADPFGPGVDPEKLIAARRAGATPADLHRRGYAGEFPTERPNDRRVAL